jgi:hypothetical protein
MRHRRTVVALLVALLIAPWTLAQQQDEKEPKESRSQYWIVLLDASLSSEQRDREQSEKIGEKGYRLRNEILTMMQTLLATLREKNLDQEDDYLDVYVFGEKTRRIEKLSAQPVRWGDIQDESWWNGSIPGDIGSTRTNYIDAVEKAANQFMSQPKEAKKNLVLISDGELDLGEINRPSRGRLEKEELARYRNFLRTDNPTMKKLADNGVTIYTLALDEDLEGSNDVARQKEIGQRLNEVRLGGASALERGLSVVDDLSGRTGRDGTLPESEGPYVLRALADQFGGKARSVQTGNVLDVMWDTVFPDQERRRLVLPPGTNKVIVSAPVDSPIRVKVWKGQDKKDVTLLYDKLRTSYTFDPPEAEEDIEQVNVRATSQYATWVISSPNLAEITLNEGEQAFERFSVLPINNVRFFWQEGMPPEKFLAGKAVELALELKWQREPPGPSIEEWRKILRDVPINAIAEITPPDSNPQKVKLRSEPLGSSPDGILRLTGRFTDTRSPGTYEVVTSLAVGNEPDAWRLRSRSVRFQAFKDSPLSTPGRFSLAVRLQKQGQLDEAVAMEEPQPGKGSSPVEMITEVPARLVFEWWADPQKGCEGVDQMLITLSSPEQPDLEILLGHAGDALKGRVIQEDGHRVCYRSTSEPLTETLLDRPLTVKASDGLTSWERTLLITTPEPLGKRVRRWLLYALLALLLATILAFALIPGLRRWLVALWVRRHADFPLAVDVAGGGSVVWQPGEKYKRFLITTDSRGDVEAEISNRKLEKGEEGFEIRPDSADEYRLRLLAGSGWTFRKLVPSKQPSVARPLGAEGVVVTFHELASGTKLEFEHQGSRVTVRHKDR